MHAACDYSPSYTPQVPAKLVTTFFDVPTRRDIDRHNRSLALLQNRNHFTKRSANASFKAETKHTIEDQVEVGVHGIPVSNEYRADEHIEDYLARERDETLRCGNLIHKWDLELFALGNETLLVFGSVHKHMNEKASISRSPSTELVYLEKCLGAALRVKDCRRVAKVLH